MKKLLFAATVVSVKASPITCPKLECLPPKIPPINEKGEPIEYRSPVRSLQKNVCFQHDVKQPTDLLLSNDCDWHAG